MLPLKELCFNEIVNKFQRFHFAYSVTNDAILKKKFEELLRSYTLRLGSELCERGKLEDIYLDFLINKHLRFLDEKWLEDSCYRDSMELIFCRLPNLTKVSLKFICTDEILKQIAEFCPDIVEIDMSRSSVTDTGIKYLCENEKGQVPCPKLRKLSIGSCDVTHESLMPLIQNLESLEEIDHKDIPLILYSLHEGDLPNLENVRSYNLIHLNLGLRHLLRMRDTPFYTDLLYLCLTVCPKLESLVCNIRTEDQLNLLRITHLKKLSLHSYRADPKIDINYFLNANGMNLTFLSVSNCIISIHVLRSSCPRLTDLNMANVIFSDDDDFQRSVFHNLARCRFSNTAFDHLSNRALRCIMSSSPKLECLKFKDCDLSSETESLILKCCDNNLLKDIQFFNTPVEFAFVKVILLRCASLKNLRLFNFPPRLKEFMEFLETLPNKPDIYIDNIHINNYEVYY